MMRIGSGMSLNENFKKKIEISRLVINPILDNLNEELINKKKEAFFTNAQCITSLKPLEFYFGFCFYNFFNVIFKYKNDSLTWTAYSCIKKASPIHSVKEYKPYDYLLIIEDIENTLKSLIPEKYFKEMKSDNYISYNTRLNYLFFSKDEYNELKRNENNDNFKTTDECLDFMIEEVKKAFGSDAENFKIIDNYDYHGWHINFTFEAYKSFTVKIHHELADGAQIVIGSEEQIRNGDYEHWFNIPMSANDFGRLTAKEFLAQLKQNLELRLNRY